MKRISIERRSQPHLSFSLILSVALLGSLIFATETQATLSVVNSPMKSAVQISDVYKISTVAGTNQDGFSGDGGTATSAQLTFPHGVAVDASGNIYIADTNNNRIRKVGAAGTIATIVGTGDFGYHGDGAAATAAQLNGPYGVAVDAAGNIYIAEPPNNRIRKVNAAGTITTIAGTGDSGFSGDGGNAGSAQLNYSRGVAVDGAGNVYIADTGNNRIRKVSAAGTITTVVGTGDSGFSGDGGVATSATLNGPTGVAADAAGNLYIADAGNNRIRKVSASGAISTFAGTGSIAYGGDGAAATAANLYIPTGVAVDTAGNLYIAEAGNHRIRKVSTAGIITTIAGTTPNGGSTFAGDGGVATSAKLYGPTGVAMDASGNIYVADAGNNRIRKLTPFVQVAVNPSPSPTATTTKTPSKTKTTTKAKTPKAVICIKGKVQYTFINNCPSGWKKKS